MRKSIHTNIGALMSLIGALMVLNITAYSQVEILADQSVQSQATAEAAAACQELQNAGPDAVAAFVSSVDQEWQQYAEQIQRLESELDLLQKKQNEQQDDPNQKEITAIESRIQSLKDEISAINKELEGLPKMKKRVDDLQNTMDLFKKQASDIIEQLGRVRAAEDQIMAITGTTTISGQSTNESIAPEIEIIKTSRAKLDNIFKEVTAKTKWTYQNENKPWYKKMDWKIQFNMKLGGLQESMKGKLKDDLLAARTAFNNLDNKRYAKILKQRELDRLNNRLYQLQPINLTSLNTGVRITALERELETLREQQKYRLAVNAQIYNNCLNALRQSIEEPSETEGEEVVIVSGEEEEVTIEGTEETQEKHVAQEPEESSTEKKAEEPSTEEKEKEPPPPLPPTEPIKEGCNRNFWNPCPDLPTVAFGGREYRTVKIGSQCWMAENLDVGQMVSSSGSKPSNNGIIEKYCYEDKPENCAKYGGLYNWFEAMRYNSGSPVRGICPEGWHIPSESDWALLAYNIGGAEKAGRKMMACENDPWGVVDLNNNASGFTALPTGRYWIWFDWDEEGSLFWTSDEMTLKGREEEAFVRTLHRESEALVGDGITTDKWAPRSWNKHSAACVRCVRD